jgi:hypothetical protein
MTTDRKFLEGYASVMRENGVSPVEAFQLMEKSAAIPWKALGLFAGGAGAAGLAGYGGMKIYQGAKNMRRDFDLYNEGLENRSSGPSPSSVAPTSNFQNWTNLDVANPTRGIAPIAPTPAPAAPAAPTTPAPNVDPLTARQNALERKHNEALAYRAGTKLKEEQRKYDEGMRSYTNPSALATMASRIPGVNYVTDWYNERTAKHLDKSKDNMDNLKRQLEEFRANAERYR